MINRSYYIRALSTFIGMPLVKVLPGVHGCGKTTILDMLQEELLRRGVPEKCIIRRSCSETDIPESTTPSELYELLRKAMGRKGKCCLLLDEIQNIRGWEKAVNALLDKGGADIYVAGSNSRLTMDEMSLYLKGRCICIPVYTLSFREYVASQGDTSRSKEELLEEYIQSGGFPGTVSSGLDAAQTSQFVNELYHSIIDDEILACHPKLQQKDLVDRQLHYFAEHVGEEVSPNVLGEALVNDQWSLSLPTVHRVLHWLEQAMLIYKCARYDIPNEFIKRNLEKYYLTDVSLIYSIIGYENAKLDAVLQNIVFLEMKRRRYDVFVGNVGEEEISFVGFRKKERVYVQACPQLPADTQEMMLTLAKLEDRHPKYIVALNQHETVEKSGIKIMNLANFLLEKKW